MLLINGLLEIAPTNDRVDIQVATLELVHRTFVGEVGNKQLLELDEAKTEKFFALVRVEDSDALDDSESFKKLVEVFVLHVTRDAADEILEVHFRRHV